MKRMKTKLVINKSAIEKFNPCQDRLDNYVKYYKNRSFTAKQFMGLRKITHNDKLWVAFRLLPAKSVRIIAGEIAQTVLHIYETKYQDNRPRLAIKAALSGRSHRAASNAAANASAAASNAAANAAAYDAANAAYYAAYAAYYAANAAYYAADAKNKLEQQQLQIVIEIIQKYQDKPNFVAA